MQETPLPVALDQEAFRRVWQRVMPEDRADCPFTVNTPAAPRQLPAPPPHTAAPSVPPGFPVRPKPPTPPVCLGEQSAGELPQLEKLLASVTDAQRMYRSLARRWPRESLLAHLTAEKLRQARRLSAARFLIAGQKLPNPTGPIPRFESLPLALRSRYRAEQENALTFLLSANASSDHCLIELYRDLGLECQEFAKRIRARLERGL